MYEVVEIVDQVEKIQKSHFKIVEFASSQHEIWDDFLEKHPASNMYQLAGWRQVLERTFGFTSIYWAALDSENEIVGVLPLFLMRKILGRKYLISNPFSNFAGVCTSDKLAREQLLERARETARREQAQYVELRQLRNRIDDEKLRASIPSRDSFVTLMLSLEDAPDFVWNQLSSRNRGKIRKAEKSGLKCDFGVKYLSEFYQIFVRNLRHLGTPPYPLAFFKNVVEVFSERINIMVLKLEDEVVAAMFLFQFKDVLAEPWVASLREYNHLYVNNLLYWKAIEYACENRFKTFDFGRSTVASGTYNFKEQFGARPIPLYYQYLLNKAKTIPVVDAHHNQYQFFINVWKRLPLFVTNFVGPKIVKYLPEL